MRSSIRNLMETKISSPLYEGDPVRLALQKCSQAFSPQCWSPALVQGTGSPALGRQGSASCPAESCRETSPGAWETIGLCKVSAQKEDGSKPFQGRQTLEWGRNCENPKVVQSREWGSCVSFSQWAGARGKTASPAPVLCIPLCQRAQSDQPRREVFLTRGKEGPIQNPVLSKKVIKCHLPDPIMDL